VQTPHLKAAIERAFGSVNTGILHKLPGTTLSNVIQRGDYDSLA
jgi:putative transposase